VRRHSLAVAVREAVQHHIEPLRQVVLADRPHLDSGRRDGPRWSDGRRWRGEVEPEDVLEVDEPVPACGRAAAEAGLRSVCWITHTGAA
jgi:hypothetical protein